MTMDSNLLPVGPTARWLPFWYADISLNNCYLSEWIAAGVSRTWYRAGWSLPLRQPWNKKQKIPSMPLPIYGCLKRSLSTCKSSSTSPLSFPCLRFAEWSSLASWLLCNLRLPKNRKRRLDTHPHSTEWNRSFHRVQIHCCDWKTYCTF